MSEIKITLVIDDEPLLARSCLRCASTEFRAIRFQKHPESDIHGSDSSQTSIALAICLNCKRLVFLI